MGFVGAMKRSLVQFVVPRVSRIDGMWAAVVCGVVVCCSNLPGIVTLLGSLEVVELGDKSM